MNKNKYSYFVSILTLVITFIFVITQIILKTTDYELWWFLSVIVFPIIIYTSYMSTNRNRVLSYFLALLNDILCFIVPYFVYHFFIALSFWNDDSETIAVLSLMIAVKIFIAVVFAIIYTINHFYTHKSHSE